MITDKINREVAEKVMEWHEHPYYSTSLQSPYVIYTWRDKNDKPMHNVNAFNPAERWDHAGMLAEKFSHYKLSKWGLRYTFKILVNPIWVSADADTAPMAICLAALEAVKEECSPPP